MTLISILQENMIKQGIEHLAKDPEKNFKSVLDMAETLTIQKNHKEILQKIRIPLLDKNSNWHQLAMRILKDTSPRTRQQLAVNLLANAIFLGIPKQKKFREEHNFEIPWCLLIDPTERCNLSCKGCWAGGYQKEASLDLSLLDRIIHEGKDLGMYFFIFSGGEPLTRKNDLLSLAKKHSDAVFLIFTNGTLIDENFAQAVVEAGNISLALSVEGFNEATDARRGPGVFDMVMKAMDLLHRAGAFFGFSTTYTRQNVEEVSSEEFIDTMIQKGCFYGWYFTYVPVGGEADLEYMATPSQRAWMYERVQIFRKTKPIFVADFWNDGEAVGGCIAGGRNYLHINASGDVEPCAFIHFSTCNIKNHSLLEALGSPLMLAYQKRQPFNQNHLCPCPLIDNPQALLEIVAETGATSTQIHNPCNHQELAQSLMSYAEEWGKIAEEIKKKNK